MKKTMLAFAAVAAFCAVAEEKAEIEKNDTPIFWGFGNTGVYSGYQLYGSLVNSEPTWQTYAELNANLLIKDIDLGYLGVGVWSNTDITDKRRDSYGQVFNEFDFNVHWGRTFWFDDDKTWGLDYRTSVVWYYYPHHLYQKHKNFGKTDTTMDWNHSFALRNPTGITPFFDWIHEYHENNADLWQFGLKYDATVTDEITITPSATFVVRDHRYNWCFPTAGFTEFHNGGLATMKLMLEANWRVFKNFGIFAKVAYCQTLDSDLRDAAEHGSGADYGKYKDFAWGGVGVTWNF